MQIEVFQPHQALALTRMWRASFEHGVGVRDPHPIEDQVAYLLDQVVPGRSVRVALQAQQICGFIAYDHQTIVQLYVRVQDIGQGLGTRLLRLAQAECSGSLSLFTFARNRRARAFYEHHGFVAIAQGFEPTWQLDDVKYRWVRGEGVGAA